VNEYTAGGVAMPQRTRQRTSAPATAQRLAEAARAALSPRRDRGMRPWAWAVLGLEAAVLVLMLFVHSRWEDEGQAWLLARDASPWDLFAHLLRYEGSPGLWHLVLMPFAKLGLPFVTIGVVSGAAALATGYMFLRWSPFPVVVRVLFPLSYFVLYQYGVIARSYCLLAPLLFGVAMLYPRWQQRPVTMAVLLCLVANVSLHGTLVALGIVVASLPAARRAWPQLSPALRRRHLAAAALGAAVLVALLAILWPPRDLGGGSTWDLGIVHLATNAPLILIHAVAINVISLLALAVTTVWLWRRRLLLLFAVPTAFLLVLYCVKYFSVWNEGPLVFVWITALWVALERAGSARVQDRAVASTRTQPHDWWLVGAMASVAMALAVEASWTAQTVFHEFSTPYSSSNTVSAYIRSHGLAGPQLDVSAYPGVAVLANFPADVDLQMNGGRPTTYWIWSTTGPLISTVQSIVAHGSPYVLLSVKPGSGQYPCLDGYRLVTTFAGGLFYKTHIAEGDASVLLQRTATWTGQEPLHPGTCGVVYTGGWVPNG
jgi:hypothetical protein